MEADYHRLLDENFGIVFNHLYTITNMPIQRFGSTLISKGEFEGYMDLLVANFQAANLDSVMCRTLLSVDYQASSMTAISTRCSPLPSPMAVAGNRI